MYIRRFINIFVLVFFFFTDLADVALDIWLLSTCGWCEEEALVAVLVEDVFDLWFFLQGGSTKKVVDFAVVGEILHGLESNSHNEYKMAPWSLSRLPQLQEAGC